MRAVLAVTSIGVYLRAFLEEFSALRRVIKKQDS
jgi:hypothetical protein